MTKDGIPLQTSDFMTASISAVGTKWLSRADAAELVLLGAGKQARNHLIATAATCRLERVNVFSPTRARREQFAVEMSGTLGLNIVPVNEPKEAIERADIVLAATNTNVPVFDGVWLRDGTHVTSIVGSNVGMVQAGVIAQKRRELDDETLTRAAVIGIARAPWQNRMNRAMFEQVRSGPLWGQGRSARDRRWSESWPSERQRHHGV
jgi:ornithine cyclodeaminase/alanine dehydrogenase-like protein (mu-crystallin family)